jgi:hypothetical protein
LVFPVHPYIRRREFRIVFYVIYFFVHENSFNHYLSLNVYIFMIFKKTCMYDLLSKHQKQRIRAKTINTYSQLRVNNIKLYENKPTKLLHFLLDAIISLTSSLLLTCTATSIPWCAVPVCSVHYYFYYPSL